MLQAHAHGYLLGSNKGKKRKEKGTLPTADASFLRPEVRRGLCLSGAFSLAWQPLGTSDPGERSTKCPEKFLPLCADKISIAVIGPKQSF